MHRMADQFIAPGGAPGSLGQQMASASPGTQAAILTLGGLAQQPAPSGVVSTGDLQPIGGQNHDGLQPMRVGGGLKRGPARALQLGAAASTSVAPITTAQTFVHPPHRHLPLTVTVYVTYAAQAVKHLVDNLR